MLVTRAFNTQGFEMERFDQANKELTRTTLFVNRAMSLMMPLMMLIMNLTTVAIIWVGSKQVSALHMEIGDMMAYMQYSLQIIMAFLMLSMMFILIPRAAVSANRVAEVLDAEESITDPENPEHFPSPFDRDYGSPDSGEDRLLKSAEVAQATEFIRAKEDGYDAPIAQGGGNVSGGQKQRLSIARALAKDAPIYIFDDSFSALDMKTDARLRAALRRETGDSTILLVAQRVSTIMDAEQIIVLDNGGIAGTGTHRELLRSCEVYRQIAGSQLSEEELTL
jgi:ABC-type multidrug transport system fused ATPase/permease subunit